MDNYNHFFRDLKNLGTLPRHAAGRRRPYRYLTGVGLLVTVFWLGTLTVAALRSDDRSLVENAVPETTRRPTPPRQIITVAGRNGTVYQMVTPGVVEARVKSRTARPAAPVLTEPRDTAPPPVRTVTVRRGDTLSAIFARFRLKPDEAYRLSRHPDARILNRLVPGQTLKIKADRDGHLQQLTYQIDPTVSLQVARIVGAEGADGGTFEAVRHTREFEIRYRYVNGLIKSSLFGAGQKVGLSDPMILKLVEIFGWDIDFALDLRKGDTFVVIQEEKYWQGQKVADGEIVAAEFRNRGKTFRAIRHTDATGKLGYYTPTGLSVRRTFLRTPVKFTRISSRFSRRRYHPLLKRWRAHKGIDYAARRGTPVLATADGRVSFAGGKGQYGNVIIIKHGGSYSTLYAHLSRFKRGIRRGNRIEQGETIGYVGSTGLVTGPHLHYELRVNGVYVDPLRFKQPKAEPIKPEYRTRFLKEARMWGARLDVIGEKLQVASSK